MCLCGFVLATLILAAPAGATMYFGATISGESYGQTGAAPLNSSAWDLFERHAGRKVAIVNQGQPWATWNKAAVEATNARGAIPLVTTGLPDGVTINDIADGKQDAAIEKWAQAAKAFGHPFLFAPWWEMNGNWYTWGRQPRFVEAWRHFHDVVAAQGATNVTWTWVVNSIWFDPLSDPTPYYPGDAYVDWTALDSYNWGRNPAQPDKWLTPDQTLSPTLKIIHEVAPAKPVAIVENASSEYGGNKANYIRELLSTYLPHHPEIGAYLWFNWNFEKGDKRADWPIESSTPAQQAFRGSIQSSYFVPGPVSLPNLTKVPRPAAAANDAPTTKDVSSAAAMADEPDLAVAPDGATTVVWSAVAGGESRVFARRIGWDGTKGTVLQLSEPVGDALAPQVAVAPDGTAIVTWSWWDGANFRIQERRISPGGTPEVAPRMLSGATQDAGDPQVDVAPDGTATIVWRRFDGFHPLIQARRIAPDGTSEEAAQRLSEPSQDAVEPEVAVGPDGTATVVWSRYDGANPIVQMRRVAPDGTLGTIDALSAVGGNAIEPQVDLAPDGAGTVVWNRFDGANWVIQGQRLSPAGAVEGSVLDLSAAGRSAAEPRLAVGADGVTTAVWDRNNGAEFIVQARRIDADGAPAGGPVDLSASGRDAAEPQVAATPDGGATVLWSRYDGANWIAQRRDLAASGSLGSVAGLSAAGRGAGGASAAWGEDGTLALAWARSAGSGEVVQAQTEPGIHPPPPPPPPPTGDGGSGVPADSAKTETAPASQLTSSFAIRKLKLNRRLGTATLTVEVPGPGWVSVDGGVYRRRQVSAAGQATLLIAAKPAARRTLALRGNVRLRLTVTFIPRSGLPSSHDLTVRLKKTIG